MMGKAQNLVAKRKDGSLFPMELTVSEAMLTATQRVFYGIIRDLSDKLKADDDLEFQREQSRAIQVSRGTPHTPTASTF